MRIIMNISHFYGGKEAIYDIYGNLIEGNLDRGEKWQDIQVQIVNFVDVKAVSFS